jgi:hypothetical protein
MNNKLFFSDLVYMDASDLCNDLYFNLMSGTSTVTRSWNIKVTIFNVHY